MNENGIFSADFIAELPDGFQEGEAFNIPDGAADFHNGHIKTVCCVADEIFYFVGNMGNDLNGFPQIISAPFFSDDGVVNLSCGQVVAFAHAGGTESLVMSQIEIGFRAVIGYEHFAVLKRTHGSGIDINIRVQFLIGDQDCWTHNLKNRDFTSFFEATFSYPIGVENDANCCAWKCLWETGEVQNDSFLYLLPRFHRKQILPSGFPSIGVGLGLVFNGTIYRGFSHRAGEFRSVFQGVGDTAQISLTEEEMDRISDDGGIRKKLASELLRNMFALIHILNPRSLYIGGDLAGQGPLIQDLLENELKEEWHRIEQTGCSLRVLEDAVMDAARGAAVSMLTELYSIPQLDGRDMSPRKWKNLLSNIIETEI